MTARIEPYLTADDACGRLLTDLVDVIETQRPGALAGEDPECVHQLRVAVRRTRAGIKAFRGVYPAERLPRYAAGFRWVQQVTGPVRDLDVQLLGFPSQPALQPLRDLLTLKRDEARWAMRTALTSHRYADLMTHWNTLLAEPAAGPEADRPVLEVAGERIDRAHRAVVKPARKIRVDSPAERLHDVRKRCKELRYLLEFFAPLYPPKPMKRLIKKLKSLQDNLGEFQDHQVQAANLRSWGEELSTAGSDDATMLAIGELIVRHEQASVETRAEFADRFARFDRPRNRQRFKNLFTGTD